MTVTRNPQDAVKTPPIRFSKAASGNVVAIRQESEALIRMYTKCGDVFSLLHENSPGHAVAVADHYRITVSRCEVVIALREVILTNSHTLPELYRHFADQTIDHLAADTLSNADVAKGIAYAELSQALRYAL